MKKKLFYSLIVGVFGALLLAGCGGSSNKVTCTGDIEEGGVKYASAEIEAEFDSSDKIKNVSASMTFESEEVASQYYAYMTALSSMAGDSVKLDAKLDGKKVTIKNYDVIASANEEDNIIGISKKEFIEKMESDKDVKVVCK